MKKITISLIAALFSAVSFAQTQKDVTQFLGIPVDGFKPAMIQELKAKGFTSTSYDKDVLEGEFNGSDVTLSIATTNNKVSRIMVSDANGIGETDIRIRFNTLCRQFQNNKRYMPASMLQSDYTISDDENISYELSVRDKRYEAVFYQLPATLDSAAVAEEIQSVVLSKYTEEQLSNPTEEIQEDVITTAISYMLEKYSKRTVWFMIDERYGKYYIIMFYDNEYNRADGEDL
ncbi:MAG: hypothetical protein LBV26_04970 [Bacteroidales bacterium]|jgi:hypothetical protein|nr:hypothetical protein [Bacteroidales bacterium]